jgi:L-fuculose-phosphate aldolase
MVAVAGGEDIKCTKYATFGTRKLSKNIISALKNRSACLIGNHGQIAFGKNLEKSFELAQEVENICHQYINALRIGIPKILTKNEIKIVLGKMKNYKRG